MSILLITVAPVVVHPEIDSKKASIKLRDSCASSIKGIAPKRLRTNQNKTTIKKPSLVLMSLLDFIFGRYKIRPKNKVITKEFKKVSRLPSL